MIVALIRFSANPRWWLCDWQASASRPLADCLAEIPFDQIGGFVFEPGGSGSGFVRFPPLPLVQAMVERVRAAGGWVMSNEKGQWVERGQVLGAAFLAGLQRLEQYPSVKEARGRGLLLALELQPHPTFTVADAYHALLERGFLVGYDPAGNVLRFDPALTIGEDDITQLLDCLAEMLGQVA